MSKSQNDRLPSHHLSHVSLKRASDGDYDPRLAQKKQRTPSTQAEGAQTRLQRTPTLYVIEALALHWSPEQISHKIRKDLPEDKEMSELRDNLPGRSMSKEKGTFAA